MVKPKAVLSTTNKRLIKSANGGTLFWVWGVAGFLAAVATIITLIVVFQDRPDPDAEACREADQIMLAGTQPASLETEDARAQQRRQVANAASIANPGGDVEKALRAWLAALDQSAIVINSDDAEEQDRLDSFLELLDSGEALRAACKSVGVDISQSDGASTADGSMSQRDARLYCNATLRIVRSIATQTTVGAEMTDQFQVMTTRSVKGLPPDVYDASAEVATMFAFASSYPVADPFAEPSTQVIADFCRGIPDADLWPTAP